MNKFAVYKFKYKIINEFLLNSNMILIVDLENKKETSNIFSQELDGEKYNIVILPNIKVKAKAAQKIVKLYLDKSELDDVLYTYTRMDIYDKIYISRKLNIYMHYLNEKDKKTLILKHYYKIKEILKKYEREELLINYNFYNGNNAIDFIKKKVTIDIDDYFYLGGLKKIIKLYKQELYKELDLKRPNLNDKMIFKYLDNYFSKFIVISYDKALTKDFLKKYYITDMQSEDQTRGFIENIIYTYNKLNGTNIDYETRYKFENVFNRSFAKKNVDKKSANVIDKLFEVNNNYNNMMFMFETIEIKKYYSTKKKIINYITALELLLTHSPKNNKSDTISKQFINKVYLCLKKINIEQFSLKELKEVYTYRSKIIHGDYNAINKCLKNLAKLDPYFINDKILKEEMYSTHLQLIENILGKRTKLLFEMIFNLYIKDYEYINILKQKIL